VRRRPSLRILLGVVVVAVALGVPVAAWATRTETACGIVTEVEQASITEVTGFSLRSADGVVSSYVIVPGRLSPTSFVPGHLREHRALATAICVAYHPLDSPRIALDLRDAPEAGPSSAP
jgi:hypothetical protein